jgi:hypothetical protein
MAAMQRALDCNGDPISVPPGTSPNQRRFMLDPCVMRSMRWGLTLALMTGVYYEIYAWGYHGTRWWYDEYDGGVGVRRRGYLGKPLGPAKRLRNGVYRRVFARGMALNNSTARARTVSLPRGYARLKGTQNPRLNTGRPVRRVTIPAHDGIVLLRR